MDDHIPGTIGRPSSAPPTTKLADLLSSFSSLRSSNRALVRTLQGSLDELRALRTNLRKQHALKSPDINPEPGTLEQYGLTRRELQVAHLLAEGRSNQAIARELKISAHTARHHTQRVLSKLEVHSRGEAGAKIRRS